METKTQDRITRRKLLRALERSLSGFNRYAREDNPEAQESYRNKVLGYAFKLSSYASDNKHLIEKIILAYKQIGVL